MLMAHSFPKLKAHKNLKGHFGTGLESSLVDFAAFPGPILMTKGTLQRVEYLYRGRLYTLDPIAPPGVVRINDFNFEPLVKSALEAKGFATAHEKPSMKVGFNEADIQKRVSDVVGKLLKGEIKHLFIIGFLNAPNLAYKSYFETFYKIFPKDCYAFSMCCPINTQNVFHLDSYNDYSFFYKLLREIKRNASFDKLNMSVFLTRCDKHTISNLLYLRHIGIKKLYMCKCPPSLINPALMQTLQEIFDIKELSDPKKDIEDNLKTQVE